jgi:hypothetical protein
MVARRTFVKAGAAMAALRGFEAAASADVPVHLWQGYDFGPGPRVRDRLNQGPFGIEQDEGWYTVATTTPSSAPVRNPGLGLVGYTWEENGPALAVRRGQERLEDAIERLAALPFVDVLYIRCDWRDVQSRPGRLDLAPVWAATFDAARRHGLRVGFRVQLSNPEIQPDRLALPDFLQAKVPLVRLRRRGGRGGPPRVEPRYDHPEFQRAFAELVALLAAETDANPLVEYVDLMMYGFWGEGHTSDWLSPFPDRATAERTFLEMTRRQMAAWTRTPLVVNTQPDISATGNAAVLDLAVSGGCWLRSDSVILDEPIQIEQLGARPPWLAAVMEDGYYRHYRLDDPRLAPDGAGVDPLEHTMRHCLDLGANYWSLWTEADNVARYHDARPAAFTALQQRLGYRVRPSWVWQRKRDGGTELVVAFANDGVAGVPGVLRVIAETPDGAVRVGGGLDAGHPHGGRLRQAALRLPRSLEGGAVRLRAEIETRGARRPVRWACAQPLTADGALEVRLLAADDPKWRKGI